MPMRVCHVSFKSPTGITHGVDVEAETLYEAAGLGLARLKKDGWIEGLGPGSRLEIRLLEPWTRTSSPSRSCISGSTAARRARLTSVIVPASSSCSGARIPHER